MQTIAIKDPFNPSPEEMLVRAALGRRQYPEADHTVVVVDQKAEWWTGRSKWLRRWSYPANLVQYFETLNHLAGGLYTISCAYPSEDPVPRERMLLTPDEAWHRLEREQWAADLAQCVRRLVEAMPLKSFAQYWPRTEGEIFLTAGRQAELARGESYATAQERLHYYQAIHTIASKECGKGWLREGRVYDLFRRAAAHTKAFDAMISDFEDHWGCCGLDRRDVDAARHHRNSERAKLKKKPTQGARRGHYV